MFNILIALGMFAGLFILLWFCASKGRAYGLDIIAKSPIHTIEVLSVAEGAVFALLGLLIAFTFSGAYERFEVRKLKVIEESNAIETAFLRTDFLAPATQEDIRNNLRAYTDSRIKVYNDLPFFRAAIAEWRHTLELKQILWTELQAACNITNDSNISIFVAESFNNMFDIANTRYVAIHIHSPTIIFFLLVVLASISAFLAGYATAKSETHHSLYLLLYVFITSFTIYIIIDMEFPRAGLIRVDSFDKVLVDTRKHLDQTP
jgi:hypothetical protein